MTGVQTCALPICLPTCPPGSTTTSYFECWVPHETTRGHGTDPLSVMHAAREFAKIELADHKYVMVLHDHQANPHVHISVRAESKHGKRLNPRKADLHRWRETFAEKLRERGLDAEATRQATRGRNRNDKPLWRIKAAEDGRLRTARAPTRQGPNAVASRAFAVKAWAEIATALAASGDKSDLALAAAIGRFVADMPAESNRRRSERAHPSVAPSKPLDQEYQK